MPRSINEIAQTILTDRRPGSDGCSNADRAHFVCEVLNCGPIDLNSVFDFHPVLQCKDANVVEASKHVAILQMEFLKRAYENGFMDQDSYEVKTADLILSVQRINWHQSFLVEGKPTPPFRFIH